MNEEEKKVNFLKRLLDQVDEKISNTEIAGYCKEGMQHYADNIIAAINPIEQDNIPYIVAVLDLCSERLKQDIDPPMMSFAEALKKVFKPCIKRVHLSID